MENDELTPLNVHDGDQKDKHLKEIGCGTAACKNVAEYAPEGKLAVLYWSWFAAKAILLVILVILPFIFYTPAEIGSLWYTPIMGIVAASLPSGGAPIAGGIVFLPVLTLNGIHASQAVAFSAATQMIGCGVLAPMNWWVAKPGIFIYKVIPVALIFGMMGTFVALLCVPLSARTPPIDVIFQDLFSSMSKLQSTDAIHMLRGAVNATVTDVPEEQMTGGDEGVDLCFAVFCVILSIYVIHGLVHDHLVEQNEEYKYTKNSVVAYAAASFVGGLITGWIGIGIEKVLFVMLTSYDKCNINRACITSISIVGWISTFAFVIHMWLLKDVPVMFWVCGLSGVHIGAMIGPTINKWIGSRNVMIVFVIFLIVDAAYKFYALGKEWTSEV
jgi:uncharacterized membrane protein YfcA